MVNELLAAIAAPARSGRLAGKVQDGPLYSLASVEQVVAGAAAARAAVGSEVVFHRLEGPRHGRRSRRRSPAGPPSSSRSARPSNTGRIFPSASMAGSPTRRVPVLRPVPAAMQAPVVRVGCSVERMGFAGTVSIEPATLIA